MCAQTIQTQTTVLFFFFLAVDKKGKYNRNISQRLNVRMRSATVILLNNHVPALADTCYQRCSSRSSSHVGGWTDKTHCKNAQVSDMVSVLAG